MIHTTDEKDVALYDTVDGVAFGPTFESEEHAEDFISWCHDVHGIFRPHLRIVKPARLRELREQWFRARVDGETGLLREEEVSA